MTAFIHSHSIVPTPFNTLVLLKKISQTRGFPDAETVKNSGY